MLQTCLIRGVADGVPNGSHACECGARQRLLAGQDAVPGASGEAVTSGSQVDDGGGERVKARRAQPQGCEVKRRGLSERAAG